MWLNIGAKTPETQLSMRELIDKMHSVMGHINSLVGKHAAITDPLQRAEIEREIAEKLFFLQDFTAKFGKAFLDRVNRNALYAGKLISNMDIRSLLSRYPKPIVSLENYKKISENNLDRFSREAREDMEMWYGLRRYANNVKNRVKSNVSAAIKSVGQKVATIQKQREAEKKKQTAKENIHESGVPIEVIKRRTEQFKRMEQLRDLGVLGEREKRELEKRAREMARR